MSNLNLKDALGIFYDSITNTNTLRTYKETLRPMADFVGNRPLSAITTADLITHINTYKKRNLSPKTVNKHIKHIKSFFNWLVNIGELTQSPAKPIKSMRVDNSVPKNKAMPKEDLQKILEYTRWFPREDAFIKFLADTACRARGVAGLRIGDIDFDTNTATVTEKFDKTRIVAFGDATANALRRWLAIRKAPNDFVFQKGNRSFSAAAAGKMVRTLCIKVGVKPRQTHSLRHAKAYELSDAGVSVTVIAKALGDTEQIVMEYYMPKDIERAVQALKAMSITEPTPEKAPDNVIVFPSKKTV
jgi:integrase/recombinase XerD